MKKSNPRLRRLLWLLDFINLEIDTMAGGDIVKLLFEMRENYYDLLPFSELIPKNPIDEEVLRDIRISELQKIYSDEEVRRVEEDYEKRRQAAIEKMSPEEEAYEHKGGSRLPSDKPFWRKEVKSVQKRIRDFIEKIFEAKDKDLGDADSEDLLDFPGKFFATVDKGGQFYVGYSSIGSKHDLEYEIAQLIYDCSPPGGLEFFGGPHSLQNLKKCQALRCQKFFWQIHKKDKNYCSNKCAWRAYADYVRKDKAKQKGGK